MEVINYSAFRANLAAIMNRVNDDHVPVLITRQNGKNAVMMSVEDYKSFEETAHLMASQRNVERLNESVKEIET